MVESRLESAQGCKGDWTVRLSVLICDAGEKVSGKAGKHRQQGQLVRQNMGVRL